METILNKDRWMWADAARGVAILLVLVGHSCPPPYTTAFIYAFHMPLFFILSGLFLKVDAPLRPWLWKRVKTLLVPFFIYNLVLLFSDWCIVALSPNAHTPIDIPGRLLGTLTFWRRGISCFSTWHSSLWFLPALFAAQFLVVGSYRLAQKTGVHGSSVSVVLWFLLSLVGVAYCHFIGKALPLSLDAALVATGFLLMGRQWVRRGINDYARWYWAVVAIVFVVSSLDNFHYLGGGDNHVDMCTDTLGLPLHFYIAAAAGSLLLIRFCQLPAMQGSQILQWMGRNSLAIYCLHRIPMNLGIAIWKAAFHFGDTSTVSITLMRSLFLVLFTLFLLVPAVYVVNRWLPWTLGKTSPKPLNS